MDYDEHGEPDDNQARGLFAIAEAIHRLGTADACTQMGALELVSAEIKAVSESVDGLSSAVSSVTDSIGSIALEMMGSSTTPKEPAATIPSTTTEEPAELIPMLPPRRIAGHADIDRLEQAGSLLASQDNCSTSHPMFLVQQYQRLVGFEEAYADGFVWLDEDGEVVNDQVLIEKLEQDPVIRRALKVPKEYFRVGYVDSWEFVTACFTRQGCKDYLAINGHKLKSPRIYVETGQHNLEWQRIRTLLRHLAGEETDEAAGKRNKLLTVRMRPEEMNVVHQLAQLRGRSISEIVRRELRDAYEQEAFGSSADDDQGKVSSLDDEST